MWVPQSRQLPIECFFPLHSLFPCAPSTPLGTPLISTRGVPHQTLPQWPKHPPSCERCTSKSWADPGARPRSSSPSKPASTPSLPKCLEAGTTTGHQWQPKAAYGKGHPGGPQRAGGGERQTACADGIHPGVQDAAAQRCLCCPWPSSKGRLHSTGVTVQ